jgi:hypothetical protein
LYSGVSLTPNLILWFESANSSSYSKGIRPLKELIDHKARREKTKKGE